MRFSSSPSQSFSSLSGSSVKLISRFFSGDCCCGWGCGCWWWRCGDVVIVVAVIDDMIPIKVCLVLLYFSSPVGKKVPTVVFSVEREMESFLINLNSNFYHLIEIKVRNLREKKWRFSICEKQMTNTKCAPKIRLGSFNFHTR